MAETALAGVAPEPGVAKPDPLLVVDGVRRDFGGVTAVDVRHLEVQRGVITALIGPNGAGKSTLFNLLTGFDRPSAGHWTFDGHDLTGKPSHRIARLGMVRNFQLTKALARMTVRENVLLAAQDQRGEKLFAGVLGGWRAQEAAARERADTLLERFKLIDKADDLAGSLSGGQRKLLDMARALMSSPRMICLDEPMAGVNPALVESLLGHITSLRDEGMTVLYVEHDMDVVMEISQWVVVLAEGRVIAEGMPDHVVTDAGVIDAYLGSAPRPVDELAPLVLDDAGEGS